MPDIVLTQRVFPETLALLRPHGTLHTNDTPDSLPKAELHTRLKHAAAVMVFMPDSVDAEFLSAAPALKIVAGALKGFDNIDLAACAARKIPVSNVPAALTVPTAELAVGLLLALTRHIVRGDARVREPGYRGWRPEFYGAGLAGKTIGIAGFGAVGQTIARRLGGFDARLLYWDPRRIPSTDETALRATYAELDTLIATSDALILAAPLVPGSRHLLNRERLARMQPHAVVVNIGRGSVADENAVASALSAGTLAGYAADVFEMEDLSLPDRPRAIPPALLAQTDRTVFTPHLGSAVVEVRKEIERQAALNIIDALEGRAPRNEVKA